jgi:hypothetical protein
MIRNTRNCAISLIFLSAVAPIFAAGSEEKDAIQAQLASALASSDYAAKKCPNLQIDTVKIAELTKRSGKTVAELRTSEDYAEQRDVIASMAGGKQAPMTCIVLPSAHGGYARGVIAEK